jgi:hypothetical protein
LTCLLASGPLALYLLGAGEHAALFNLLSIDVFLAVLLPFLQGAPQGLQRFGQMAAIGIANPILRFGVAISTLWLGLGLVGILVGWVIGDLVATIFSAFLAVQGFRGEARDHLTSLFRSPLCFEPSDISGGFGGSVSDIAPFGTDRSGDLQSGRHGFWGAGSSLRRDRKCATSAVIGDAW